MIKNIEATQKHLKNLSKAQEMLNTIIEHVETEKRSKNVADETCSWTMAGESARIVEDLTDLYNRIMKQGEYA